MDEGETAPRPGNPERLLALHYAPPGARAAVAALFGLDDLLGGILRSTREPLVGQMRLTWWHDALQRLDHAAPPAEPLLAALARHVLPRGISGDALAPMIEGWEVLLEETIADDAALERHAVQRGVALFGVAARVLGGGPGDPVAPAGRGWALADLARNIADPIVATRALALARPALDVATSARWSSPLRSLGALAHLAAMDVAVPLDRPVQTGSPRRVMRLFYHRLTGR